VRLAFSRGAKGLDGPIWHQISIDVPRTNPGIRLWQGEGTQRVSSVDLRHEAQGSLKTDFGRFRACAHRVSKGSSTFGQSDIPPVVTSRVSTISSLPSSKSFFPPTSVRTLSSRSLSRRLMKLTRDFVDKQTSILKPTTFRRCLPPSSKRLKPIHSGVCQNCSTEFRTTTSLLSRGFNGRLRG
jgi:hypothetical protein